MCLARRAALPIVLATDYWDCHRSADIGRVVRPSKFSTIRCSDCQKGGADRDGLNDFIVAAGVQGPSVIWYSRPGSCHPAFKAR